MRLWRRALVKVYILKNILVGGTVPGGLGPEAFPEGHHFVGALGRAHGSSLFLRAPVHRSRALSGTFPIVLPLNLRRLSIAIPCTVASRACVLMIIVNSARRAYSGRAETVHLDRVRQKRTRELGCLVCPLAWSCLVSWFSLLLCLPCCSV